VVQAIDQDSKQLASALVDNTKIVITTLQKFPFVLKGLLHVAGADKLDAPTAEEREQAKEWQDAIAKRRYAVIVDEAHSSQTGEAARELKAILGSAAKDAVKGEDGEEPDWEDGLNQVMKSRGRQPNVSFFAFTATPKGKTLEIFGRKGASGKPEAFHIYSMRQAIQEGFILDVVRNYTTYKVYFKLVKEIEDDPALPKKKAAKALGKFMSLHPHNLEQKTEVIIEHFRRNIMAKLGGRAKAMVVTSSRLHAVRYMQAFKRYLAENGYSDMRPLVAFSGTVKDPDTGDEYTEPGMNIDSVTGKNISEKQLPEKFNSPDYQILLVANKYQTGFDQPLLLAMYVDKRLDGVQAVQTLSRLNRMVPGKETPFVLDFVNESEDIYSAFKPYYDATSLQESADPQQLENMKNELDSAQVYHWSEVEAFSKVFYKMEGRQEKKDNAELAKWIQPSCDRFKTLESEEKREEFKGKLDSFVHTYSFLSQVMPYCDPSLEMLYSFGTLLLPQLSSLKDSSRVKLGNEVELQYYRMQRIHSGVIDLTDGEAEGVKSPVDVGTGKANEEKAPLSEIIKILNDKFATNFTDEDRLFFEQIREKAAKSDEVVKLKQANPFDKFQLGLKELVAKLMIQRMSDNDKIVTRYMDDKNFESAAFAVLSRAIYDSIPSSSGAK